MVRDLMADLALCEASPKGPWKDSHIDYLQEDEAIIWIKNESEPFVIIGKQAREIAKMVAESREGWPEAIRQAIEAKAKISELEKALKDASQNVKKLEEILQEMFCDLKNFVPEEKPAFGHGPYRLGLASKSQIENL